MDTKRNPEPRVQSGRAQRRTTRLAMLKAQPFEDLGYADDRSPSRGAPGRGRGGLRRGQDRRSRSPASARHLAAAGADNILITRLRRGEGRVRSAGRFRADYDPDLAGRRRRADGRSSASAPSPMATGGTSDMPVAEEAARDGRGARAAASFGSYDVGVAGTAPAAGAARQAAGRPRGHRHRRAWRARSRACVGGLVSLPGRSPCPPASATAPAFNGLAALLSMLNSCASGVSVVNIDNGFGAGFLAHRINTMPGL